VWVNTGGKLDLKQRQSLLLHHGTEEEGGHTEEEEEGEEKEEEETEIDSVLSSPQVKSSVNETMIFQHLNT